MTTIGIEMSSSSQPSFAEIDASIRTLTDYARNDRTLLASGSKERLVRTLKVYTAVKPLLRALSFVPLLPTNWRAALVLFLETLDALALTAEGAGDDFPPPEPRIEFKAGKDLRQDQPAADAGVPQE
jgi:hypothetical protein